MKKIVGIVGFIGSGKNTAAEYFVQNGYKLESFASSLKDTVSSIFQWDRSLLEGDTEESRVFRETIDEWWSVRLNIKNLTPRFVLQHFGTDLFRDHFHSDIWIASVEKKLINSSDNIVISDVRFMNEVEALRRYDATIIRIRKGEDPVWYKYIETNVDYDINHPLLRNVHPSEYGLIGCEFDYVIDNDSTIEELYNKLEKIL